MADGSDAIARDARAAHGAGERFLSDLERASSLGGGHHGVPDQKHAEGVGLIMAHVHFAGVLPKHAIALSVLFEATPRIAGAHCTVVDQVAEGLWQLVARSDSSKSRICGGRCDDARGSTRRSISTRPCSWGHATHRAETKRREPERLALDAIRVSLTAIGESGRSVQSGAENVIEIARQIAI